MKVSKLIEILRQFHNDEVCVRCGYNLYTLDENIIYDKQRKLIAIDLYIEDIDNEIGYLSNDEK